MKIYNLTKDTETDFGKLTIDNDNSEKGERK